MIRLRVPFCSLSGAVARVRFVNKRLRDEEWVSADFTMVVSLRASQVPLGRKQGAIDCVVSDTRLSRISRDCFTVGAGT